MQTLQTIKDIASNIQIKYSDLSIGHVNYQFIETPIVIKTQIQTLPIKIQDEYLISMLKGLIRGIYYDGIIARKNSKSLKIDYLDFEKNISEIDWEFYEQLDNNNTGKGSFYPGFRVVRQESDGSLAVEHLGVTVHIQPEKHLQPAQRSASVGDLVAVWIPPSQLKPGYYTAIGDELVDFDFKAPQVMVHFNFSSEGAVATMQSLTALLNAIKLPFTFMVLYNPSNYGLYTSGILRFERKNYELVRQILQTIYTENQSYFQIQVPFFTKMLAPGLALAEVPKQQLFKIWNDFGGTCCQIIANALLEAHKNDEELPEIRTKYILQYLEGFNINVEYPYLNFDSEDIYTPLV